MTDILGQPFDRQISYPIAASDIRKWVIATYYPEPPPSAYLDPEAAESGELAAPPYFDPFSWGAAQQFPNPREIPGDPEYAWLGAVEPKLGVPAPDLHHALNGGLAATYTGVTMHPGDVITNEYVLASYSEREGRLGTMLITERDSAFINQRGELIKTNRMTTIRY
jgi:N-terminal half of MaoC dehydratase